MEDKLDLSVPEKKPAQQKGSKSTVILLVVIMCACIADLAVSLLPARRCSCREKRRSGSGLSADAVKDLALKLEKQGLHERAAQAWKEYLAGKSPDSEERAKIWFRIGTCYQDSDAYVKALDSYYRSESFAQPEELKDEISRRVQECLEYAGKFAALRYELADRVGIGEDEKGAGGEAVAEVGGRVITKAELDRKIEQMVERQLEQYAAFLPEADIRKQKEQMVKRFASGRERINLLNQIIIEEVLYRKAREDSLMEDPDVRKMLMDAERGLLAQQVLQKECAERITIMPGDLKIFYEARKEDYVSPEQARISHILVADKTKAENLIEKVKKGQSFEKLAAAHSLDPETKGKKGEIEGWVSRDGYIPGIGRDNDMMRALFSVKAGNAVSEPFKSEKGYHVFFVREKKTERQKDFSEVRQEVYRALRAEKEKEVQKQLLETLKERYDVVIHASELESGNSGEKKKGAGDG